MKQFISVCSVWMLLLVAAILCFPGGQALADTIASDEARYFVPMIGLGGLIDIFDKRTMLEAIAQMKRPGRFLRDSFFPLTRQFDTTKVDLDIVKGKRRMAPFVSPVAEGRVVERLGFNTNTLEPGTLKPKMPTTAADLLKRQPGEVLYDGGMSIEQRAQMQLGKDMADLLDQIERREEWLAAQALNAGAVTMTIKGETADKTVSVDFNMAATHKITLAGADLWTDAASNPLEDMATWARLIRQDSGVSPDKVILGTDAAEAFMSNAKVKAELDLRRVDTGEIKPAELPDGVSYLGRINRPGLFVDIYTYDEWYISEADGNEYPMVPADKAWMGCSRAQNTRLYAAIQDMKAIQGGLAAVKRFPKTWETEDPSVLWLMIQSAPLMALNQPDAFVTADVV